MLRQLLSATVCVWLLGSFAPPALAQGTNAPPGNSGVDQYLETVPEAGGNRSATGREGDRGLPARTVERLRAAGADGEAVANLVSSTGPTRAEREAGRQGKSRGGREGGNQSDPSGQHASAPSRSVPRNIAASAVGGSGPGGMGVLLPVLLAASAIGAAALVLLRRRQQ
jgi:hypothetical protein